MRNWIEERAEKLRAKESVRQREREWQFLQEQAIKENGRAILDRLFEAIESDVRAFNALFPDDPAKRIERVERTASGGFLVHQTHYPTVLLEVSLNSDQLEFVYTKTPTPQSLSFQIRGRFFLRLSESGDIYVCQDSKPLSCPGTSRILLEPILS